MPETKKAKTLEKDGKYSAKIVNPLPNSSYKKGDEVVYHKSVMQTLVNKGVVDNVKHIPKWKPKHAKS